MGYLKQIYAACIENNIDPATVQDAELDKVNALWLYFRNIDYAVEAYKAGYTADELRSKGNYPPYWVYLLWVKA